LEKGCGIYTVGVGWLCSDVYYLRSLSSSSDLDTLGERTFCFFTTMHFLPGALRTDGREQAHDLEKDGMTAKVSPSPPPPPPLAHRATVLETEAMDQLNMFRHMVGIHSTKGFIPQLLHPQKTGLFEACYSNLHFDGRAAPNVGIVSQQQHYLYLERPED
jgi:hypothetical protein